MDPSPSARGALAASAPGPGPALAASRRRWVAAFWGYIAVLATISLAAYLRLLPRESGPLSLPHVDTVLHFVFLGGASYLSHRALGGRREQVGPLGVPLGPFIVALVSVFDECFQAFVPVRTFSLLDMAANLSGVVTFGWLAERAIRAQGERAAPPSP
jgi:hypothetical protein